jgi:ATP-dependent helicase HrpB
MASGWAREASHSGEGSHRADLSDGVLLALAYPERIAKARGEPGRYLLANGRGGVLDAADPLAQSPYLVVADLSGRAESTRILLAAPMTEAEALDVAAGRITEREELTFDRTAQALRARRVRRLDAIVMASDPVAVRPGAEATAVLLAGIASLGVDRLPWSKPQKQLRERLAFLRSHDPASGDRWPDLSDATLTATLDGWLGPFIQGKTRLADIGADDLGAALDVLAPYALRQRLEAAAPSHYEAPTGNRVPIAYDGPGAPAISIRVQELFGLTRHPAIADGRLPLTLDLLSPAHRTIQITRDLPGFWAGSWKSVRADMRGRYPRHPWPENPAEAPPTARAKPRGT